MQNKLTERMEDGEWRRLKSNLQTDNVSIELFEMADYVWKLVSSLNVPLHDPNRFACKNEKVRTLHDQEEWVGERGESTSWKYISLLSEIVVYDLPREGELLACHFCWMNCFSPQQNFVVLQVTM